VKTARLIERIDLLTKEYPSEEKKVEWKGTTAGNVVRKRSFESQSDDFCDRQWRQTLFKSLTDPSLEPSPQATNILNTESPSLVK
jgi:hypothetical protein